VHQATGSNVRIDPVHFPQILQNGPGRILDGRDMAEEIQYLRKEKSRFRDEIAQFPLR